MIRLATGLALLATLSTLPAARSPQERALKGNAAIERAEDLRARGLYREAREAWDAVPVDAIPPEQQRWRELRVLDCGWRAEDRDDRADTPWTDEARSGLAKLADPAVPADERDRAWAEAAESLGDLFWSRRVRDWGQAWPRYQAALGWWGASREIDLARTRYLSIVRRVVDPPWGEGNRWLHGLPQDVRENALRIAVDEQDRALAHYLVAIGLSRQGSWDARARSEGQFEAALELGRGAGWYDDALFAFAEWMATGGRIVVTEDGGRRAEPDYPRALALYRRLVEEFPEGESAYRRNAERRIENILAPQLSLQVPGIFLPGSLVEVGIGWRNVERVELELWAVDLTRDVDLAGSGDGPWGWLQHVDLSRAERLASWTQETGDRGDHVPGQTSFEVGPPRLDVEPGAYVLDARARGQHVRELILVGDGVVVLETTPDEALVWVCDAIGGAPVPGARVRLWSREYSGSQWSWREATASADEQGIARFELPPSDHQRDFFAAAVAGPRQAFSIGGGWATRRPPADAWRVLVSTDRPAYRPGDRALWKVVARHVQDGLQRTPAGARVEMRITDPQGAEVSSETLELNEFGSAWGELELTSTMPLGAFTIELQHGGNHIGGSQLLRLEEYKLPEFRVRVSTPIDEEGRRVAHRLGERVEIEVAAEYYAGGALAGAEVELRVHQRPFHRIWHRPHPFPWYHEDAGLSMHRGWAGPGQLVQSETLRTDARGRASLSIETPAGAGGDLEYTVEARVRDASRREVVAQSSIRVGLRRYAVQGEPRHRVNRPGAEAIVDFRALDLNDQPVRVEGVVRVLRRTGGDPLPEPRGRSTRRAPADELVGVHPLATDAEGRAELAFRPDRVGHYVLVWESRDDDGAPIRSETAIWVADEDTRDLGFVQGDLLLIVDRESFRAGEQAPVMVMTPASGRWVLFAVQADGILEHRLLHLDGTVKLLDLALDERHVPNVFLSATMVAGARIHQALIEVVVPPVDQFLDVRVVPEREDVRPGERVGLEVTALDADGEPVRAEIDLAVYDEAVLAIQQELAGDPRQVFHGEKRQRRVDERSTLQMRPYLRLVRGADGEPVDERHARLDDEAGAGGGREGAEKKDYREAGDTVRADSFLGAAVAEAEAPMAQRARAGADLGELGYAGDEGNAPSVVVRTDFRATAFWRPDVVTGPDGRARVEVPFPQSLTSWRATARAVTTGTRVGQGSAEARTRQPLAVRVQTPRFLVAGDLAVVSAVLVNDTERDLVVEISMQAEGLRVVGRGADPRNPVEGEPPAVTVAAGAQERVDWVVRAEEIGEATIEVAARSGELSDAERRGLPVHDHGLEQLAARSARLDGEELVLTLDVPAERRRDTTELAVVVTPSPAVVLLDALPYLIDYPYGCTEQTLSRFLPTVVVARTLTDLGLDAEDVAARAFGGLTGAAGEERRTGAAEDLERLDAMVAAGLERLMDFQHSDGGWGWWKTDESDPFMTAYALWGLTLAREAGVDVDVAALERAADHLRRRLVEGERRPDLAAWMLHALAVHGSADAGAGPGEHETRALERLAERRDGLNAYGLALAALAAHHQGRADLARELAGVLADSAHVDETPDTSVVQRGPQGSSPLVEPSARWGEAGLFHRWWQGGVESTAFALRALLAIEPDHELVDPAAGWLLRNRRGASWSNTRDTSIAILALTDHLLASGALDAGAGWELSVNGETVDARTVGVEDVLTAPTRFVVAPESVRDGANEVRLRRTAGSSPLWIAASARFVSREEPIRPLGSELFLRRGYLRLVEIPTLLDGWALERRPLAEGEVVASGDRLEVVLTVEAKNELEYVVLEDLKPAGLEAVALQSGARATVRELSTSGLARRLAGESSAEARAEDWTGRSRGAHVELRDRKVALFLDRLPQGVWEVRYELRAEAPGRYHALPVTGHAMYAPDVRGNGLETTLRVAD